ncbi:MAG: SWIM zinc finger domain-containing protein [bacterium]
MNEKVKNYAVSTLLYDLTEKQIVILDQEATGGEGWYLYCDSYINRPTVFKNKISGRFRNFSEDYFVEVKVDERQITTFCSTCRRGEICVHAVALLYSWIYDSEGFINVADSIKQFEGMDKGELIEIIARMLLKDAGNLEVVDENARDEDDYDLEGLLN